MKNFTIRAIFTLLLLAMSTLVSVQCQSLSRREIRELRKTEDPDKIDLLRSVMGNSFLMPIRNDSTIQVPIIVKVREPYPIEVEKVIYRDTCFNMPTKTNRELRTERKTTRIDASKEVKLATIEKDKQIGLLRYRVDSISTLLIKKRRLAITEGKVSRDTVKTLSRVREIQSRNKLKEVRLENRSSLRWYHIPLFFCVFAMGLIIFWILGKANFKI